MGFTMRAVGLLGLFSFVLAVPSPQAGGLLPPAGNDACAAVSQAQAKQMAANPRVAPRISAATAFACLQSVPNKPEPAMKLATSFRAYAQWQSTLAWLKDPPPSYTFAPTDVIQGIDAIAANASAGRFQSEYDFQVAMVQLVGTANDGHFAIRPDIFKAFNFRNDLLADLVSVSVDGKQLPKLYNLGVLNGTGAIGGGNKTLPASNSTNGMAPAIVKINGQDAAKLIEDLGLQFINTQDPDSQWNAQFQQYAVPTARTPLASSIFYMGDSVTVEYDNGQKVTQESYALIRATANFTGVNTGEDFYQKFCTPKAAPGAGAGGGQPTMPQQPRPTTPTGPPPPPPPAIPGFPMPAIRDNGANVTAGYFLSGAGYEDVAVLSILGFAPEGDMALIEYLDNAQKVTEGFLAMCKQAGKKRLVIDLTGNGGGLVAAGYDLYSQLFPDTPLFQATNMRLTDSMDSIARVAASLQGEIEAIASSSISRRNATQRQLALAELSGNSVVVNLLPGNVFSAGGRTNLTSTEQIIEPVTIKGDRFTAYTSTPLNQTASDFNLTGSGNRANPPPAVFDANNIVLLTDGTCGSTCTLFSYLMIMQENVKTVAVGGRPQAGPMQSIGGVEGAQVFPFGEIQAAAAATLVLAPAEQQEQLRRTDLGVLAEGYLVERALSPAAPGSVNGKNAFSHTDSQTPLQFLTQPAQCRFFYTKEMIYGPEATWKRAVDATFKDPQGLCVEGSIMPTAGVQSVTTDFFKNSMPEMMRAGLETSSGVRSVSAAGAGRGLVVVVAALAGVVFLI